MSPPLLAKGREKGVRTQLSETTEGLGDETVGIWTGWDCGGFSTFV